MYAAHPNVFRSTRYKVGTAIVNPLVAPCCSLHSHTCGPISRAPVGSLPVARFRQGHSCGSLTPPSGAEVARFRARAADLRQSSADSTSTPTPPARARGCRGCWRSRSTEINAFVIDVKDERASATGSEIELANELAQPARSPSATSRRWPTRFARTASGPSPASSSSRTRSWRAPTRSGRPQPNGGRGGPRRQPWVSPWDDRVWDYNIASPRRWRARASTRSSSTTCASPSSTAAPAQVHPRAQGDRTDAIAAFLNEAKRRLHPLGVTVTADVFGLSPNTFDDVGIGQQWETLGAVADHILPMMYPVALLLHAPPQRPHAGPDAVRDGLQVAAWRGSATTG
jgi:hypothetical protein